MQNYVNILENDECPKRKCMTYRHKQKEIINKYFKKRSNSLALKKISNKDKELPTKLATIFRSSSFGKRNGRSNMDSWW